ncbi:Alpha/Beta hydrolase protein [Kockovaella imperatae]|uniref:carboxypeptidase C n=1 Tax=Kockovaella imperatae TaxID=4999 RepID=A0A1Y1UE20_9TREE|nr:Alpha/Beta hydrolase protein [Kockovaella imperatae]ORX36239.1 Alpha/Beta hydrolase protein [Kockovaella imperatae]
MHLPLALLSLAVSPTYARPQQQPWRALPETIAKPRLCPDSNFTQYSGYVPGSEIFFWFFPSRSDPSKDPIGVWTNGGPGSSALMGMQYVGPCEVVEGDHGPEMRRREWSFNDHASILMIDNPRGAGFSFAKFPAVDNIYDGARDAWIFLQSFFKVFPEYQANALAVNSASYGGHYCPAYASFIQHMNAKIAGEPSLWEDIWEDEATDDAIRLNLTSISIGNGFINNRVQARFNIEYACGGADIPMLGDAEECEWARKQIDMAEELMDTCRSKVECSAAGLWTDKVSSFPYETTGLNPYDYRRSEPYDETHIIAFYNNASVQAALGVIQPGQPAKVWESHSRRVAAEFILSGDWDERTDYLFARLLKSGVGILKYEGMVDWICNYLGVRQVMQNLTDYQHQKAWNRIDMKPWYGQGDVSAGRYKCHQHNGEAPLCYVEVEDAGHVVSTDKPKEGSWLVGKWMNDREI